MAHDHQHGHHADHPHAGHGKAHAHPHGTPQYHPNAHGHGGVAAEETGVMGRLKAATQDLHSAAEAHELQRLLFKGRLAKDTYIEHLGQLFLVHTALERHIRRLRPMTPALAAVVKDEQFQEVYLRQDFSHFGVAPNDFEPTAATRRLIAEIDRAAAENPIALLGFHYVLEGSNNGSKYIAMAVRKAYGLTPGQGDRYLDPYGDAQAANWQGFKRDMESVGFSETDVKSLIASARSMFDAISAIGDDLLARQAAT